MQPVLTFIIPVRHPQNARDWQQLKNNLSQTAASIARQTDSRWKAVVVANTEADLPALPHGFEVKRVDFPPNQGYERGTQALEDFYEAVRADKGRRILAGMLHAGQTDYLMVADDDDFISCNLTAFVAANTGGYGWRVHYGYIWSGGNLLYAYHDFSRYCGTSHIVRADLYKLPVRFEDAEETYIRKMLGSHIFIEDHLKDTGTPLTPLPFYGAIYRTGHAGAHSSSQAILKKFFINREVLCNPLRLGKRLLNLRWMTEGIKQEFFGS